MEADIYGNPTPIFGFILQFDTHPPHLRIITFALLSFINFIAASRLSILLFSYLTAAQ